MKTTRLRFGLNVALALMLCSLAACAAGVAPSPSSRSTSSAVTKTPHATALLASLQTPTPLPSTPRQPPPTSAPLTLTIVYDNNPFDARLKTAWGFACLIETGAATILFDTGGDGRLLMDNLTTLGVDPRAIDAVVLSHVHSDHTDGLDQLLAANDRLTVYLPRSFPASFKSRIHNPVVEVHDPVMITDRIRTTGELGAAIVEQALIVETDQGLIVVTGCAHPGVANVVRAAKAYGEVHLVVGGFHLADESIDEVKAVIAELKRLGVQKIAPSHCTGEKAIEQFRNEFGTGFIPIGAGAVIHVAQ